MSFDVVIPLGPNDLDIISKCVESLHKYVNLRTIYIVSYKDIDISGATVLNESIFPFTHENIKRITSERSGWYLQQLIKLYAPFVIPNLSTFFLIFDADTILYKKISFFEQGIPLYDFNRETHMPYFDHMKKLHPSFIQWKPHTSGIVNMMIMNKETLSEIFGLVEEYHKKPFWSAFLDCLDVTKGSSASEYEIYFHYVMRKKKTKVRHLQYDNFGKRKDEKANGYAYRTYHWHFQKY